LPDARLDFPQSGLAKSPCRGFATRNLTGVGEADPGFFWPTDRRVPGTGYGLVAFAGQIRRNHERAHAIMLGRHVYRVHATGEAWLVRKEGEEEPRGSFARREEAIAVACRLAGADLPARVTIDNGDGTLAEERLFGADQGEEI
jgi:hypothetical protein